jgi:hypothetical protein
VRERGYKGEKEIYREGEMNKLTFPTYVAGTIQIKKREGRKRQRNRMRKRER